MATINVVLHTAAYIAIGDPLYVEGKRAAYKMTVDLTDANQATVDGFKGAEGNLAGVSASAWSRVSGIGASEVILSSPPSGLAVNIGPVTPENLQTGKRRVTVSSTPPGAAHATRWVGWATIGTVWVGAPAAPVGLPPNYSSPGTGLDRLFFANLSCSGVPVVQTTAEPYWVNQPNDALIPGGGDFSSSSRGSFKMPTTGTYRWRVPSDDGLRMWINGAPIIDDWTNHAGDRYSGELTFTAGQVVNVRIENFNTAGGGGNTSTLVVMWSINGAAYVQMPVTVMYPIGYDVPAPDAPKPVQKAFGVDFVRRYFP